MTNFINAIAAADISSFLTQNVVGGLTMWMVLAITLAIVIVCIILIVIISKSSNKKAKKKADIVLAVGDDSSKPDRPSEPVEPVKPSVVPDVVDTASEPEEVALSEASTNSEATEEVEKAEETPAEEKPVEEAAPVAEEKPVEEVAPVEEEKPVEEVAPVVEEKPVEEAAPVVEEKPVEEVAPVVEEKPVEEAAPVVEEKPAEEAPKKVVKPPVKKTAAKKPPVRKAAPKADTAATAAAAPAGDKNNITLLFGEAPEPSNGRYVIIKDTKNAIRPYKFQLKANNGQILYESENYKIKPKAKQVDGFRNTINNGTYAIDEEKNGTFRYKIFKVDGTMYGVGEGYKSRAAAESAIESVKKFANSANFIEDTTIDTTETK